MKCPKCNSEMILRPSKYGNGLFWGCSRYPTCRETMRYTDDAEIKMQQSTFRPTPEQEDIFKHIKQRKGNLIIQAVAGSGKTTTILSALQYVPVGARSIFLAFNKSIANSIADRAPSHVEVRTLHSLGFRFITAKLPKIQLDIDKIEHILDNLVEDNNKAIRSVCSSIYSYLLNNNLPFEEESIEDVADYYNLDLPGSLQDITELVRKIHTRSTELYNKGISVSFDDLIYRPAVDLSLCSSYDYIFVDEVQDLNKIQIRFLLNCVHKTSQSSTMVVAVGDRAQSIYGFRGADSAAMDTMKTALNATELPLSVCFRCPASHIVMAKKFVPQITSKPGAEEGIISQLKAHEFVDKVNAQDLVICRLNAPLVPMAFQLLKAGKPAFLKGKDIAGQITTLLTKEKNKDVNAAIDFIVSRTNSKVKKLMEQNKINQASYALDICDCAIYFLQDESVTSVQDAIYMVGDIFKEDGDGVTLSSIHKAKGLEANRVFIVNFHNQPMSTKSAWETQQEFNLMYVAVTRAKKEMYLVKVD